MNHLVFLAILDWMIQIIGFIMAFLMQTEKFYDITGSATFILLVQMSFRWRQRPSYRQIFVTCIVTVWALRLGSFLLYRVLQSGGDKRFDKVKTKPKVFFIYWTIQGAWIYITLLPTLLLNNKSDNHPLTYKDLIGFAIWAGGFFIEVLADYQKYVFKNDPDNHGRFINSGLWSISRHPNYFGEIVMWVGIFFVASSVFSGMEWLSIISPMFLYYLLCYLSGIPILERSGMKNYGHMDSYKHYVETVPVLTPFVGSTK